MFQQLIAISIIAIIIFRLFLQVRKEKIGKAEFYLWLFFWLTAGLAIVFIRRIDAFVASLGFSASGIDVLLYAAAAVLFYLIFRLRLRVERTERNITRLVREMALKDGVSKNNKS